MSLWLVWTLADIWLTAPRWAWYLLLAGAGFIIEWRIGEHWWLGAGLAGAAIILNMLTDLVLVATDACKVAVLRNARK